MEEDLSDKAGSDSDSVPDLVDEQNKKDEWKKVDNVVIAKIIYDKDNRPKVVYENTCNAVLYVHKGNFFFVKLREENETKVNNKNLVQTLMKVAIDFETFLTLVVMALTMSCPFSFLNAFVFLLILYYMGEAYGFTKIKKNLV